MKKINAYLLLCSTFLVVACAKEIPMEVLVEESTEKQRVKLVQTAKPDSVIETTAVEMEKPLAEEISETEYEEIEEATTGSLEETENSDYKEETLTEEKNAINNEILLTNIENINVLPNVGNEKIQSMNVPLGENNVIDLSSWNFGMTPLQWVYIEPNIQIISNNSPNKSPKFGYKQMVSSGAKGCLIPIFSKCDSLGSDFDGRFYCFEDYKKSLPEDMMWEGKFSDMMYGDYNVLELLRKKYDVTEVGKGVVKIGNEYVNIVYISELDEIIMSSNNGN